MALCMHRSGYREVSVASVHGLPHNKHILDIVGKAGDRG